MLTRTTASILKDFRRNDGDVFRSGRNGEVISMLYTIIAGVNGCGKSSFTGVFSTYDKKLGTVIDTDSITAKIGGNKLLGGKEAVKRIDYCLENRLDFTQETTLSGAKTLRTVMKARERGYDIRLYYIAVGSAEESVRRIKNRVARGGHDIPEETVNRRFKTRFSDLLKILRYCDAAEFYDNENGYVKVGEYSNGKLSAFGEYKPQWFKELIDISEKIW